MIASSAFSLPLSAMREAMMSVSEVASGPKESDGSPASSDSSRVLIRLPLWPRAISRFPAVL